MSQDLKPCPFCGETPIIDGRSEDTRIRCEGCGAQGGPEHFDAEVDIGDDSIPAAEGRAIEKWNRRAVPKEPA